jgi:hypothetical protein
MKRPPQKEDLVAERIAWIDRVTRAIDSAPGACFPIAVDIRRFREKLETIRDGIVLGANLARYKP